jgi:hypothetical protein
VSRNETIALVVVQWRIAIGCIGQRINPRVLRVA